MKFLSSDVLGMASRRIPILGIRGAWVKLTPERYSASRADDGPGMCPAADLPRLRVCRRSRSVIHYALYVGRSGKDPSRYLRRLIYTFLTSSADRQRPHPGCQQRHTKRFVWGGWAPCFRPNLGFGLVRRGDSGESFNGSVTEEKETHLPGNRIS